jgi:hypothetical protein
MLRTGYKMAEGQVEERSDKGRGKCLLDVCIMNRQKGL